MTQTLIAATLRPSRVPWSALADILEIARPNDALPVRVRCPLCNEQQLSVYDHAGGGEWAHCYEAKCGFSGDMLELAAATWNMPIETAVTRLKDLGVPLDGDETTTEAVTTYAERFQGGRNRARKFWTECRERLAKASSPDLNTLLVKFRLMNGTTGNDWRRGPGLFIGSAHAKDIEAFFRPACRQTNDHITGSPGKVLRGPCWRDVLVTASYSAPGLLCGFHFLGRNGDAEDRVFRQLERNYGKAARLEAGLVGLDAVEISRQMPSHVFAVDDPWLALRLQVRYFQTDLKPLPLVAWHDSGRYLTQLAWRSFPDRRIVLICTRLNAATIYQAYQSGADLWLMPLRHGTEGDRSTIFRDLTPLGLVKRAVREARPWMDVLKSCAPKQQPGVIEKLLQKLKTYPNIDAAYLAKELGLYHAQDVLDGVPIRQVTLGASRVVERPEGWFASGGRKGPEYLISDARFQIDRILGGAVPARYEGRIFFNGDTIKFSELAGEMEKKPARVIVRLCLQAGLGRPSIRPHRCGLMQIATAFHRAEVIKVVSNKARARQPANESSN